MRADLHTHSTASDGLLTPAELLQTASHAGVNVLALTDHDTTAGIVAAQAEGVNLGIEVIPGIEINTDLPNGGEAHVLGYFLDWQGATFQAELTQRREARIARGQQMVAKLQRMGIPITWEQVLSHADGAVGRPHVAAALMDLGIVSNVGEAFERYLGRGMPAFVPREPFAPDQAVALIRQAGGIASLAHPAYIAALATLLPELVSHGLQGLEVYYGQFPPETVDELRALADKYGLIPTGGSDYHGPNIHPTPLGHQPPLPEASLTALRAAKGR